MTDREMLELAAKAAEIEGSYGFASDDYYYHGNTEGILTTLPDGQSYVWNPLTDDGDAFRLAVTLNIDIEFREGEMWAYRHAFADGECFTATERLSDHQPKNCGTGFRATRRAIVRAAAEIERGKT